jgi:ketosteroid isomerase-like protein
MTDATLIHDLTQRERQRRDALVGDDMAALGELMMDDLVHVHTTGIVQGKAELLGHAGSFLQFIEVERGPLNIRQIGDDAAVMTGPMTNTVKRRDIDERITVRAYVTQVWVRHDSVWRVASFHATRLPDDDQGR